MRTVWPAPAKLNLFLRITGRRPDGYHTLQTLFQFLDFGDELRFVVREDGRVRRVGACADIPEEQDLSVRAARALQEAAGVSRGVDIAIEKRIPLGGGLGGGSSDAATTLLALNVLWGLGWSRSRLAELGLRLGADVPVFVQGHAAWAEGVGEHLTPVGPPETWYVVLTPPAHASTGQIFAAYARERELTGYSEPLKIRDFRAAPGTNDLESVVRRLHPEVDQALCWLATHGDAHMTGSGASVFLAVGSAEEGRRILAQRPSGYAGFVARGINAHPLCNEG